MVTIGIYITEEAQGLPLPSYASSGAAGMDLHAAVPSHDPVHLVPGARTLVSTGLVVVIPEGYEGQVRARSGLAFKHGIGILNGPGTIDSDYRGVLRVLLINWGDEPFEISRGDRIAQLVVAPVIQAKIQVIESVPPSDRGTGGFGSTGITMDIHRSFQIDRKLE